MWKADVNGWDSETKSSEDSDGKNAELPNTSFEKSSVPEQRMKTSKMEVLPAIALKISSIVTDLLLLEVYSLHFISTIFSLHSTFQSTSSARQPVF